MTGNYHGSIHVLINLNSFYQSLAQLFEHDHVISYPLNFNILNILLLGERAEEEKGAGGPVGLQIFLFGLAWPVDRSTGLKDRPNSSLRPNFSGPDGPTRPAGNPIHACL